MQSIQVSAQESQCSLVDKSVRKKVSAVYTSQCARESVTLASFMAMKRALPDSASEFPISEMQLRNQPRFMV